MAVMDYLTVSIPVGLWKRVDGCADNSMAMDVVDAIMESVIAGSCVRDAGWRASAAYLGERDQYGWPPTEHRLPVVLRREHWEWVLDQLQRWEPYEADDSFTEVRELIVQGLNPASDDRSALPSQSTARSATRRPGAVVDEQVVQIHVGPVGDDEEHRQDMLRLNLLAHERQALARMEQQSQFIAEAARAAAHAKIEPKYRGPDGVEFAHEIADSVLDAVLTAMRDGPPAGT
jgi:hypothetical protein